jgi:GAF domain-containing protein
MSSDFVSEAPKIEELMINDDDEAAICSLARITALAIENLQRYNGATEGISQASSAIQALQKHIANLEDAAAIHVACRLQTEEARDKGLQLLTLSSSNQVNVSYLLEVIFILYST